jgi:predicted NBD/HSP70 family sugar kinase
MKKATSLQTKLHNRDLVLRTIFSRDSISRAEIARMTNLTKTTVSEVVNGLLLEGLVEEVGKGESLGGKTPILLSIVADSRHMIGLNLSQSKFMGAIVNLRGEIKQRIEVFIHDANGENALKSVYQILDELTREKNLNLIGIGVGAPGLINSREGVVINAVNLDWHDLELGKLLNKRYQMPVTILNDSQATAIGEYVYKPNNKLEENYIVVNVNQGIGAGILINGKLFQGDGGGAGEIGHVVLNENGEQCRCGKRGCLETISSTRAVLHQLNAPSLEPAIAAYKGSDPKTRQVVDSAAHYLGISLANMIGVLNIRKLILTGDMVRFGADWLSTVKASMQESALTRMSEDTTVEIGKFGSDACILGASAFLLLDDYSLLFSKEK